MTQLHAPSWIMGLLSARASVVAAVLAVGATDALSGQSVRGAVTDSATRAPLGSCHVSLLDAKQRAVAGVTTDSAGGFVLRAPGPGTYTLRFERIGYVTVESQTLALDAESDTPVAVALAASAVGLPPVTVTALAGRDARLEEAGFYQRKGAGQGFFLDPGEIAKRLPRARMFADLLRGTPGVAVLRTGSGSRDAAPKLRGMSSLTRACTLPQVYVNGSLANVSEDARQGARDLNEIVQPEQVLAVEVYRGPSEIPEQYNGPESGCGVLLIWTKH